MHCSLSANYGPVNGSVVTSPLEIRKLRDTKVRKVAEGLLIGSRWPEASAQVSLGPESGLLASSERCALGMPLASVEAAEASLTRAPGGGLQRWLVPGCSRKTAWGIGGEF